MRKKTLEQFVTELSSKAAVPGGGGASALAGAIGAALASMVASLTTGKKKYACYQEDIERMLSEAKELANRLLDFIEEDAAAFEPLSKAYGLPKETPKEQEYKEKVMEEALKAASLVPIQIIETALKVVSLQEELLEKGSVLAVSDVGVGVQMLQAAVQGASLNVFINTRMMKDRKQAIELNEQTEKLVKEASKRCEQVFQAVKERLV